MRHYSYSDAVLIGDPEKFKEKFMNNLYSYGWLHLLSEREALEVGKENVKVRINFQQTPVKTGYILSYNINAISSVSRPKLAFPLLLLIIPLIFSFISVFASLIFLISLAYLLYVINKIPPNPDLRTIVSEIDRMLYIAAEESCEYEIPSDIPQLKNSGPFSHGIEKEYAIVTENGTMYRDTAGRATEVFEKIIKEIPSYYTLQNVERRGFRLIWRDESYPTQLEIATRICHDLEDVEKELTHLTKVAIEPSKNRVLKI